MTLRLTVEQLETRDLLSGIVELIASPQLPAPANSQRAEVRFISSSAEDRIGDSPLLAGAELRTTAGGSSVRTGQRADQRWDRLLVGTWYVPAANLLAYRVVSYGADPVSLADQTIFQIPSAQRGVFSGTVVTYLSQPLGGGFGAGPFHYTMTGVVTPQGQIRITFTPVDPTQPTITGIGTMQFVRGEWRMAMQMATGTFPYVIHWAYMTKLPPGVTPPPPEEPPPGGSLRSGEWRWLRGTRWSLADTELSDMPTGSGFRVGTFQIDSYRNGYFWGNGQGPTPFTVVGSVTPEGRVFLVLSMEGGPSVTRTGVLQQTGGGRWVMRFRSYEGPPQFGEAQLLGESCATEWSRVRQP